MADNTDFYEEDEDPQAIWAEFDSAKKSVTARPGNSWHEWGLPPKPAPPPEHELVWAYDQAARRLMLAEYTGSGTWVDLDGRSDRSDHINHWRELDVPQPPDEAHEG